jgi:Ca2+-binding EF-hand superfamily protein
MGNMQELWIEPVALVPKNMPKLLSQPIPFMPSVRYGGESLINAARLKADQAYEVTCEDKRDEALASLLPEEMDAIKATFQQCDLNGDGGISRTEMSELVRKRTYERKAIIDAKFDAFLSEPGITRDEILSAESNKATLMQSMHEAQNKLLKMFEAADVDGDGVISFTEFIMAEAWWMRCTINPDRAHLF